MTGQFYEKISGNVGACVVSVYQALLSAYEREPGFEASRVVVSFPDPTSREEKGSGEFGPFPWFGRL